MNTENEKSERRRYCANHYVPRWAFVSSLSTLIMIAIVFAGWHVASLDKLEIKMDAHLTLMEKRIQDQYIREVTRFYQAAEKNQALLKKTNNKLESC